MFRKNKLAMLVGEFLGTAVLTSVVLAISHSQLSLAYFVSLAAGLAMLALTLALGGISGAIFNPAITIALFTVRKIRALQAVSYLIVQLAGGYVAWLLFVYFTKLSSVPNNGHFEARIMVAEVVGTFVFSFVWAAAVYQRYSVYARAATLGLGLTIGSMIASLGSSGLLNPAVALGARSWGWLTYVLGPILGAVIGFNLYNLLFIETEIAEVEEAKAEVAEVTAVAATLKPATRRASTARKPRATTAKKPATRRASTGSNARSNSRNRRNPNAV